MKVCILLCLVFIATAESSPCASEDSCLNRLVANYKTYQDLIPWVDDIRNRQFCKDAIQVLECLGNSNQECQGAIYTLPKAVLTKVCDRSANGRGEIHRLMTSRCVTDENRRNTAFAAVAAHCSPFNDRIKRFQAGKMMEGPACRLTIQLRWCVEEALQTECGADVEMLVSDLYSEFTKKWLRCSTELKGALFLFKRLLNVV